MAYANLNDVQTRLGRAISDDAEVRQVLAWLGDAERIIKRRYPDLATRVEEGTVTTADLKQVESQAVIRKIKNPDGHTYESIDDVRYGLREDDAQGEIYITDAEWALLDGEAGSSGAFTIWPFPQVLL